jgi:hypothetical protein
VQKILNRFRFSRSRKRFARICIKVEKMFNALAEPYTWALGALICFLISFQGQHLPNIPLRDYYGWSLKEGEVHIAPGEGGCILLCRVGGFHRCRTWV